MTDRAALRVATARLAAADGAILRALRGKALEFFGGEAGYCALGMVHAGSPRDGSGAGFLVTGHAANGKPAPWRQAISVEVAFDRDTGEPIRVRVRYAADGVRRDVAVSVSEERLAAAVARALGKL